MATKKLTLYADEDVIKEAKKIAIDRDVSLSSIVSDFLEELVKHENNKNRSDKNTSQE